MPAASASFWGARLVCARLPSAHHAPCAASPSTAHRRFQLVRCCFVWYLRRCCAGFGALQVLTTAIAASKFTAAEALHRMTDGMANIEGPRNGELRPTLATKWRFSVNQPASAINAHVGALQQFLVRTPHWQFGFFRV